MVPITIVNGVYKPSYNWGAPKKHLQINSPHGPRTDGGMARVPGEAQHGRHGASAVGLKDGASFWTRVPPKIARVVVTFIYKCVSMTTLYWS
jgi:hypothetical protein